ncbi:28S ribosomal protein S27, mitochondrial [Uranotaenia lowii]|uniref:28S ribosomal protein S27, mitochondrial n=1 Tax=Uranotaenia lowii TaxID=190385 RepID=UPI002479FF69|nr:28S ribosomal protein S27, mitochondrial [Uranotaenia lowii]
MYRHILLRPVTSLRSFQIISRNFLSEAFSCREAWQSRLSTPTLAKLNQETLYYDLEQRFQQKQKISAIDIDIYANKLEDDSHIEEVADLMHKFRLTEEASNVLDSTQHAIVRNYVEHSHYSELIEILNNRIGYGIFLDDYTANLSLDRLITTNEFKWAARFATLLALQEDFENPITRTLATYACYRYVKGGQIEPFDDLIPAPVEEPEEGQKKKKKEEIKVRVKFLRNPFFDDHFDLTDSKALLGKTLYVLGLNSEGIVANNCHLLGSILHGKFEQSLKFIEANKGKEISQEIVTSAKGYLEQVEQKDSVEYTKLVEAFDNMQSTMKISNDNFEKILLDAINKAVSENESKQINQQKQIYSDWCTLRQQRLDDELTRLQRAKRIQDLEKIARDMEQDEQKLWFFENEDKIDLQIDSKKVFHPKRWFGKKKKPRTVDEGYVPPEVRQRQGLN